MRLNDVTIYHIRSNSALRTPRYHGQFALSLGKDSSYELSWGWSRAVTPHRKEMLKKTFMKKGDTWANSGLACVLSVLFTPLGDVISLMKYPLSRQLYFASVFLTWVRVWHWNLGLIIEKWAFGNFQGWPKKDTMRMSCDSVSNIHWCSKHVKYN